MLRIPIITSCLPAGCRLFADTEIKGTPTELSNYLTGIPKNVVITGEAEVRVSADKAIVSLKVSTESKALHDTLALEPGSEIQAGRFSPETGHSIRPCPGFQVFLHAEIRPVRREGEELPRGYL